MRLIVRSSDDSLFLKFRQKRLTFVQNSHHRTYSVDSVPLLLLLKPLSCSVCNNIK